MASGLSPLMSQTSLTKDSAVCQCIASNTPNPYFRTLDIRLVHGTVVPFRVAELKMSYRGERRAQQLFTPVQEYCVHSESAWQVEWYPYCATSWSRALTGFATGPG